MKRCFGKVLVLAVAVLFFSVQGSAEIKRALPPGETIQNKTLPPQDQIKIQDYKGISLKATLDSNPLDYKGNCPGKITFKGKITLSAGMALTKPVEVKYRFKRSDGATDTNVKTLTFTQPGSQDVSTTWEIGGQSLPVYCGWASIEIISPKQVESNQAPFSLLCSNVQVPDLKVTDIYAIPLPPGGPHKCTVGFKIKNVGGGGVGSDYAQCVFSSLAGKVCNGTLCQSHSLPIKNSRNPGGEDVYTDKWPGTPFVDFSKPFSVKMQFVRRVGIQNHFTTTGPEFSMTQTLTCP